MFIISSHPPHNYKIKNVTTFFKTVTTHLNVIYYFLTIPPHNYKIKNVATFFKTVTIFIKQNVEPTFS
jgi:hypothetical protein